MLNTACSSDDAGTPQPEPDAGAGDVTGDTVVEDDGSGMADVEPEVLLGTDQTIVALEDAHVFWTGWDEGQNAREVENRVTMPSADELYSQIEMTFALSCPDGSCDPWDRLGSFGVVTDIDTDDEQYIEISRFITPYAVGAEWTIDVTDLRPLLADRVDFRVFIDTWVGPGSRFGNGWSVDVSFDFVGGEPEKTVLGVIPVWSMQRVNYGDPLQPVADQISSNGVDLPEGTRTAALRTFITGHGQGNNDNCAEFCPREHTFVAGGVNYSRDVWRDDCETSSAPNQQGTFQYPRAGWCPGAVTHDWTIDLGDVGLFLSLDYDVEAYENTCRPDSADCSGCALGNGCEWNDSNHTEPNYQITALVIAYGE